jgi:hypothetical protein
MIQTEQKISEEVRDEKEQEAKKFSVGGYRKGLLLFAMDNVSLGVYQVEVKKKVVKEKDLSWEKAKDEKEKKIGFVQDGDGVFAGIAVQNPSESSFNVNINPNHFHVWAMNKKNAMRKFKNML